MFYVPRTFGNIEWIYKVDATCNQFRASANFLNLKTKKYAFNTYIYVWLYDACKNDFTKINTELTVLTETKHLLLEPIWTHASQIYDILQKREYCYYIILRLIVDATCYLNNNR